ncbi:hypothetical protein Q3G72_017277 [Acer saccharum]|nr:hypothetical protein Q3G72_017277 [Acer saccharum]
MFPRGPYVQPDDVVSLWCHISPFWLVSSSPSGHDRSFSFFDTRQGTASTDQTLHYQVGMSPPFKLRNILAVFFAGENRIYSKSNHQGEGSLMVALGVGIRSEGTALMDVLLLCLQSIVEEGPPSLKGSNGVLRGGLPTELKRQPHKVEGRDLLLPTLCFTRIFQLNNELKFKNGSENTAWLLCQTKHSIIKRTSFGIPFKVSDLYENNIDPQPSSTPFALGLHALYELQVFNECFVSNRP